jgi:hypothetical protein
MYFAKSQCYVLESCKYNRQLPIDLQHKLIHEGAHVTQDSEIVYVEVAYAYHTSLFLIKLISIRMIILNHKQP